jgi:hypothetical protein
LAHPGLAPLLPPHLLDLLPTLSSSGQALLQSALSSGTSKQYRAKIRSWTTWCVHRRLDFTSAGVSEIVNFLADLRKVSFIVYNQFYILAS